MENDDDVKCIDSENWYSGNSLNYEEEYERLLEVCDKLKKENTEYLNCIMTLTKVFGQSAELLDKSKEM